MRANNQNFLETIKNIPETNNSINISHAWAIPRNTWEGIVVMNAIGTKILKNILNENEKEFKGNLPIYRKERNTSIAFHVFTNQIVVVEIKNHKLYRIAIEQNKVVRHKSKNTIFIFIWLIPMQ